ncbi:RnfABCDGE type electron transport complex subunit G [Cellulosilyticum sp. I15G10I2]|uniref:RnfABCDGE type electron transport complex subunit G n=1 Tax=Cellulosilyticum sp. I15G10I2 TaxID=1892843 RepID=UPI00085C2469|nr:RnfABCDGE type electron transport complex subunit G [Cellulosilyticum sp. I15G10I2]
MRESLKLGILLFVITAVCAGMLGLINRTTTPVIAQNKADSEQQAMKMLIEEAETFSKVENIEDEKIKEVYVAKSGEEVIGTIAKVMPNGYGGEITVLIGFDLESQIKGIKILSHTETPGFGANATKPTFIDQFLQKLPPLKVVKATPQEDEIVAITGATITSDAIVEGVNQAAAYVIEHQQELHMGGK